MFSPYFLVGQNIHDPYIDVNGLSSSTYQATGTQYINNYQGEYQFYLPSNHAWSEVPNAEFSVKTECVSFPFLPVFKYHNVVDQSNQGYRLLGIPNSNTLANNSKEEYFIIQNYYNPSPTNQTFLNSPNFDNKQNFLYTQFQGEAWYSVGWSISNYNGFLSTISTNTDNNTLISDFFIRSNTGMSQGTNSRNLFPHSILKHTLYVRSNCDPNEIDSLVYIVDLTRGSMVNFPFTNAAINPTGAGVVQYDIVVKFEAEAQTEYGQTGSNFTSEHTGSIYPIYNYFTPDNTNWLFETDINCTNTRYIPNTYPSSGDFLQGIGKPHIKLPQYSYTGVLLLNHNLTNRAGYNNSSSTLSYINPLYKHTYRIDRYYDITYINPSEKIVYNPSEVEIDLVNTNNTGSHTLTFPSGYTFKTVLGNYPEKSAVAAADPNNYYGKKPFSIPVPNDANTGNYTSKYIIKNGSKLVIEDCVTIIDAEIVVETGATLEYNSNAVYGNYTITNAGGTILNGTGTTSCIQDCLNTTISSNDWQDQTINADLTLPANTIKRVFGTLIIAAGKKLTLEQGVRLEFAPNSRVIVENGARFITNGVSGNEVQLTSMCENMWDGIELRGSSLNSTAYAVLNYTTLQNAYTGIRSYSTRNKDDFFGVVKVFNSTVLNCITGVDIKTPINSGCCWHSNEFLYSSFITDNDIPDIRLSVVNPNKPTITHIKLNGIGNRSGFVSCTFHNQNTWLKPHERGIGISVMDASLRLGRHLLTDVNTFTNLSVGIKMSDKLQFAFTQIDDAIFTDNIYGIIVQNRDYVDLHNNTFHVPESTGNAINSMYNRPTGVYVTSSNGFVIYDNTFDGTSTNTAPNCGNCNQAIIVEDTDAEYDYQGNGLILNNVFDGLDVGFLAQGDNRGYYFITGNGLDYVDGVGVSAACNTFNVLGSYDMALSELSYLTGQGPVYFSPIRDQGYCWVDPSTPTNSILYPALNTFNACSGQTRQLHNYFQNKKFVYYHASNNLPACNQQVVMEFCNYLSNPNSNISKCNDYYSNFDPVSLPLTGKRQQYIDKVAELEERTNSFDDLLDGGNTANLLDVVQNGLLANAVTQLETAGAYISDTVLVAAVARLGVEETQKLILILQANSKLSPAVWDAVVTHTNTYSSGLVEALTAYQEGVSARDSYIKWIDYTAYERNTIFNGLYFADMLNDSNLTEALDVLRNNDDSYIQKKLLPLLITEGEYTEAETLLNTIKQTDNNSLYILEQEAKLLMSRDGIGFYELPESLKDALAQYWIDAPQQSSWSAMQAGVHSWQYYINPRLLGGTAENNKWDGVQDDFSKEELKNSAFLTCYPNPTTSGGTIKGIVPILNNATNQVKIYNSIGQMIITKRIGTEQFEINIQLPAKGLYFVALYQNHTLIKYQKWVVQ